MRRLLAGFLLLAMVIVAGAAAATVPAQEKSGPSLRSVEAEFSQQKHLQILARPIISTGRFAFQAPQSLRWEYRDPIASVLLMHDGVVRKFVERDGQMIEERGMPMGPLQLVMSQISSWLCGSFSDTELFLVESVDARTVRFVPKEKSVSEVIAAIEVILGDRPGLLDSVKISEGPESYTLITFSKQVLNGDLPPTMFTTP